GPLVSQRAFSCNLFEIFVKSGDTLKPAFITNLLNIQLVVNQKFTGISHPYFDEKPGKSFAGSRLEIAAKGMAAHSGNSCNVVQRDPLPEMLHGILVNGVDPFVFAILKRSE